MPTSLVIIIFLILLSLGEVFFVYLYTVRAKKHLKKQEEETNRRWYELAVLKELGERIGYSLNVQNIVDIISGSLHQFIEYSTVSYMLFGPEKIIFKTHLEKSVSRRFIDEIRDRMLKSLSILLNREFTKDQVEEILSGAILVEEFEGPVRSLFNIPIVIGEKVQGVLTVAHTQEGLYKEEEMTILYKITHQASQAVARFEEAVKTEQMKLNAMVESMEDGVVMTDKDYRILVANPAVKNIIGWEKKEEPTIFDFIAILGEKFDIRGKLEESIKLGKHLTVEGVFLMEKFYKVFVTPVRSSSQIEAQEILGGAVVFHDITHEKEIERLKEDFTAMMVHELRSPLDAVKNLSQILQQEVMKKDEKTYQEPLQMIFSSSSRMLEQVNDLLDVAKLEAGKFSVSRTKGKIAEVIQERIKYFELLAQNKNISLGAVVADFPEVSFDRRATGQVLDNLLSNAIKFTAPGGKVSVHSFLHKTGGTLESELGEKYMVWSDSAKYYPELADAVVIAVVDTGPGIPAGEIEKVFSRFQQLETARRSEKRGTGLGLFIVSSMVKAQGGTTGVGSTEGKGSTFYFTIPLVF